MFTSKRSFLAPNQLLQCYEMHQDRTALGFSFRTPLVIEQWYIDSHTQCILHVAFLLLHFTIFSPHSTSGTQIGIQSQWIYFGVVIACNYTKYKNMCLREIQINYKIAEIWCTTWVHCAKIVCAKRGTWMKSIFSMLTLKSEINQIILGNFLFTHHLCTVIILLNSLWYLINFVHKRNQTKMNSHSRNLLLEFKNCSFKINPIEGSVCSEMFWPVSNKIPQLHQGQLNVKSCIVDSDIKLHSLWWGPLKGFLHNSPVSLPPSL